MPHFGTKVQAPSYSLPPPHINKHSPVLCFRNLVLGGFLRERKAVVMRIFWGLENGQRKGCVHLRGPPSSLGMGYINLKVYRALAANASNLNSS